MSKLKRKILLVVLFVFVWLITFNAAYVNGDDVVHMVGKYGNGVFLVNPNDHGIPNRLFDSYFRGLSTAVFDALYFPLKLIFAANFFYFYKFYTATIFAGFITCASSFFLNKTSNFLRQFSGDRRLADFEGFILDAFICVATIYIFPWFNQVHLICYQIPAFLGLVIALQLIESSMDSYREINNEKNEGVNSQFLIISLLFAFSLETYTLSMCFFCVIWIFAQYRLIGSKTIKNLNDYFNQFQNFNNLALVFVLCISSICIGVFQSSRLHQGIRNDLGIDLYLRLGLSGEGFYVGAIFVALFGIFIIARLCVTNNDFLGPFKKVKLNYILGLLAMLVSQISVVTLMCLLSGIDYFSSKQYPWGDFLLILKCALILTLFVLIALVLLDKRALRWFALITVFILSTKLVFDPLFSSYAHYRKSAMIKNAYDQVALGKSGGFESGMNLEIIPMGIKPLPERDSPDWFKDSYQRFFYKYYDVNTPIYFW